MASFVRTPVVVFQVLLVSSLMPQFNDLSASSHEISVDDARQIIADFLVPDSDEAPVDLTELFSQRIDATRDNEHLQTFVSKCHWVMISVEEKEIRSVLYGCNNPPQFSLYSASEKREVTKEEFKEKVVRILMEDARRHAVRYITRRYGEDALSDLKLETASLADSGNTFLYRFSWSNPPDANGVFIGTTYFRIEINPETGNPYKFSHIRKTVDSSPKMSPEQVRRIADDMLGERGLLTSAELVAIRLSQINAMEARSQLVWLVSYRISSQPGSMGVSVKILDETAEVLAVTG